MILLSSDVFVSKIADSYFDGAVGVGVGVGVNATNAANVVYSDTMGLV